MGKSNKKQPPIVLSAKDKTLDADTIDLLRAINRGRVSFEPEARTAEGLERFQQIVKVLRMLESRRCIADICSLNLVPGDGRVCIDRVRLTGGLTEKGRTVLALYETDQHAAA